MKNSIFAVLNGTEKQIPAVNPGGWFGRTYLVATLFGEYIVEADTQADALDTFVDSEYGGLIALDGECTCEDLDECSCNFAGNDCQRVEMANVSISVICCDDLRYFGEGIPKHGLPPTALEYFQSISFCGTGCRDVEAAKNSFVSFLLASENKLELDDLKTFQSLFEHAFDAGWHSGFDACHALPARLAAYDERHRSEIVSFDI